MPLYYKIPLIFVIVFSTVFLLWPTPSVTGETGLCDGIVEGVSGGCGAYHYNAKLGGGFSYMAYSFEHGWPPSNVPTLGMREGGDFSPLRASIGANVMGIVAMGVLPLISWILPKKTK